MNKKNSGFGKVSRDIMKRNDISIQAKCLYALLCCYRDDNGEAYPSIMTLSRKLNKTYPMMFRYLYELESKKIIKISKQKKENGNNKNYFKILDNLSNKQENKNKINNDFFPIKSIDNINDNNVMDFIKKKLKKNIKLWESGDFLELFSYLFYKKFKRIYKKSIPKIECKNIQNLIREYENKRIQNLILYVFSEWDSLDFGKGNFANSPNINLLYGYRNMLIHESDEYFEDRENI